MGTKKQKKRSFSSRMRELFMKSEMPQPIASGYRIEMFGQKQLSRALVCGTRRILACDAERVVLETKEECLNFIGKELECLCYEGGIAEIYGDIRGFSLGKEREA